MSYFLLLGTDASEEIHCYHIKDIYREKERKKERKKERERERNTFNFINGERQFMINLNIKTLNEGHTVCNLNPIFTN
jgi:hypothetical protein